MEIICKPIVHCKVCLLLSLHSLKNKSIWQVCVPYIWQLFCQGRWADQDFSLGKCVGKTSHLIKTMVIISSAASFMNNILRTCLSSCLCSHIRHGLMSGVFQSLCSKHADVGSLGEISLVYITPYKSAKESSMHVVTCGISWSASQYSIFFRFCWTELDISLSHFNTQINAMWGCQERIRTRKQKC